MRISDRQVTNQMIQYMNDTKARMNELSNQISSGKLFQNPSDNPAQVADAMTIKSTLRTGQTFLDNANRISGWMEASDKAFSQLSTLSIRATGLIQKGLSDTIGPNERINALASEMDGILYEAMDMANSTFMGQYIFSGYQIHTRPFEVSATDPNIVQYNGDAGIMHHDIGTGQSVSTNINNSASMQALFNAVIRARNALQTDNRAELEASLTDISAAQDEIGNLRSTNGARMRQVDSAINYLEKSNLTLKGLLSEKEDVNMAEAIANLTNQETTYQAVLEVGQRAISALNLFDLLR